MGRAHPATLLARRRTAFFAQRTQAISVGALLTPSEPIAVVGLGYVGLPVVLAFAQRVPGTFGFDVSRTKIAELDSGYDRTGEVSSEELTSTSLTFSDDTTDLGSATFVVVAVPTPIDHNRLPDVSTLRSTAETVGRALRPGTVVAFQSTVYPGVSEDICGATLERTSGLRRAHDFILGDSPERINPSDHEHTLERIVKVVSGENTSTLVRVAGVYRVPSIRVAEAAKVIENT